MNQQSAVGSKQQTAKITGVAFVAPSAKPKQRQHAQGGPEHNEEVLGDRYMKSKEIEFNSHVLRNSTKFEESPTKQQHMTMDRSPNHKKSSVSQSSLHLTEQNRKMIK